MAAERAGICSVPDVDGVSGCSGVATTRLPELGKSTFAIIAFLESLLMTTMARFPVAVTDDSTISRAGRFHREEGFLATASFLKWRESQFRHAFDWLIHAGMPHHALLHFGSHRETFRRLARLLNVIGIREL